jgi:hypothetical protein
MSVRADYAARMLFQFVSTGEQAPTGAPPKKSKYSDEERATRAAAIRDQMHAMLDKGEQPKGPKADWIRESAGHVLELLTEIAQQYNVTHDEDAAITGDVLDILATVREHLTDDD